MLKIGDKVKVIYIGGSESKLLLGSLGRKGVVVQIFSCYPLIRFVDNGDELHIAEYRLEKICHQ